MGEHIFIRGEGGSVFKLDPPLHEAIEDRLRKGMIHRVNEDGSAYEGDPGDVPGVPTSVPNATALKPEWVGWAVAQGEDAEAAEAMTKADLIDKYGQPSA